MVYLKSFVNSTAKMYYKSTDNLSNIPIKYCQKYSQFEINLRNTFLAFSMLFSPQFLVMNIEFLNFPYHLFYSLISIFIFTDCNVI